ncbi:MAG TPA: glycerophosphodiester phosphodiesterase [Acidimicrobiales bacterium]|nr:glycerophosphodiester phosphodiesterase [Acidimicrobiales bacterium]
MTEVIAHRGAHLHARENTLAAFRDAVALGVDGVELDVRKILDGALVVHHDPTIGPWAIAHTDARDLPSYVPTLEEALEALEGVAVNVEIKNLKHPKEPTYDESGTFVREVLDLVHAKRRNSSVVLSCFDLASCTHARTYDPAMYVGWLVRKGSLFEALERAHALRLSAVNPHFTMVTPASQLRASELDMSLNVWTVNEPKDIAAMVALGVASIITDQPALALELLGRG